VQFQFMMQDYLKKTGGLTPTEAGLKKYVKSLGLDTNLVSEKGYKAAAQMGGLGVPWFMHLLFGAAGAEPAKLQEAQEKAMIRAGIPKPLVEMLLGGDRGIMAARDFGYIGTIAGAGKGAFDFKSDIAAGRAKMLKEGVGLKAYLGEGPATAREVVAAGKGVSMEIGNATMKITGNASIEISRDVAKSIGLGETGFDDIKTGLAWIMDKMTSWSGSLGFGAYGTAMGSVGTITGPSAPMTPLSAHRTKAHP
jgi:hypothetical protein